MERLVDESGVGVRGQNDPKAADDFRVTRARKPSQRETHRPDMRLAGVWTGHAFGRLPFQVPRIGVAEDEPAGVHVQRVVRRVNPEIGQRDEARHIGIVHVEPVAEAIHLVGVHLPEPEMFGNGVRLHGRVHLIREFGASHGEVRISQDFQIDFGQLTKRLDREQVRGDEEGVEGGVVGGPEGGGDQAGGADRVPGPLERRCIDHDRASADEPVRGRAVLSLFRAEDVQHRPHRPVPIPVEDGNVAGLFGVAIGQTDGVAQGVDLPLPLVDAWHHFGAVFVPHRHAGRVLVEGVRPRIEQNAFRLPPHQPLDEPAQAVVFFHQGEIGPYLRGGIAQPHRVDVARDDERIGLPIDYLEIDGRIQRVRKTVLEHPRELLIADGRLHLGDRALDGRAREVTLRQWRTLALIRRPGEHPGERQANRPGHRGQGRGAKEGAAMHKRSV